MLKQQTIDKLRKMNMQPMVDAAASVDGAAGKLTKEEWLDMLVDRLYEERMATKVNNLVKAAHLPCPEAYIEDLITDADRELDIGLIDRLASCAYIPKGHNVIVLGASGAGKSWIVSALALSACRQFYKVECVSMPEMVDELGTLRYDPAAHAKRVKQLKNRQLLVIDDVCEASHTSSSMPGVFGISSSHAANLSLLSTQRAQVRCPAYVLAAAIRGFPAASAIPPADCC